MDLKNNQIPDKVKKIHLIAICGTGMGALACILKDLGFEITGSDQKIYPPMSRFLLDKGIAVTRGFNEANLSYSPDLVIVGNAVSKDNPEIRKMQKMGLNFCSMPQAVNKFVVGNKKPMIITGTHGKTTTASILTWMLQEAGLDPTFIIGGILQNYNSNYRLGKGEYIIIEGDEYDTAFFDKGPKFLHYNPFIAVLTSIEFDHADIFQDIEHVCRTFDKFISGISQNRTLVAFDGDKNISRLFSSPICRIVKYGEDILSTWRFNNINIDPPWTFFEVYKKGNIFGSFKTKLVGRHNLLNALSVIAIADNLRMPVTIISKALETFKGVKRRQEIRGQKKGITVMDDFAHHPTAIRQTLEGLITHYPGHRIWALFEPRSNTTRRNVFQNDFAPAFEKAYGVAIGRINRAHLLEPKERLNRNQIVTSLTAQGKPAFYSDSVDEIIDWLVPQLQKGDLVVIMSNGAFDGIHTKLLAQLQKG